MCQVNQSLFITARGVIDMGGLGHFFHFIMMLIVGPWWIPVWVLCALICGSKQKKETLKLLRKIANKGDK